MKKLIACAALCLLTVGCASAEIPEKPEIVEEFSSSQWQLVRSGIPKNLAPVDVVETTFTKEGEEDGIAMAQYLGGLLSIFPRYASSLRDSLASPSDEFMLMTALMSTAGTEVGSAGATGPLVYYVDKKLGGSGLFITEEQVQQALEYYFGEDIEVAHASVPSDADEENQFVYHEQYGVYSYPKSPPLWYLPLILDIEQVTHNSFDVRFVFVRYADSRQNSFFGFEPQPIARWDMEVYVNYNIDRYNVYTATVQQKFGRLYLLELSKDKK